MADDLWRTGAPQAAEVKSATSYLPPAVAASLVELLPAASYVLEFGSPNRTTYISPQISKLLGYSPADWLSNQQLWLDRLYEEDRPWVLRAICEADQRGEPIDLEYRAVARDGRVVWLQNRSTILASPEGKPFVAHGLMLDVTRRKTVEQTVQSVIHDGIVQDAVGAKMHLESFVAQHRTELGNLAEQIEPILNHLAASIDHARSLACELRLSPAAQRPSAM